MEARSGVEKNETSDFQVQVMPSGDVAITISCIDNRMHNPEGSKTAARVFETDV